VLKILHEARANGESAKVDAGLLRTRTQLGLEELQTLLQKMLEAGWVGSLKGDAPRRSAWNKRLADGLDRWTLLINPESLKLVDVYRLFVFDSATHVGEDQQLVNRVESAVSLVLDQTLASYFSDGAQAPDLREVSSVTLTAVD
jgi:membrane protein